MAAAAAGGRRLDLSSISCRSVSAFVPFQKPPLYAAVSLAGRRHKTPPDPDGGESPEWEQPVGFDLGATPQPLLLEFEVKAQVPLLGNKLVGTAHVPVADLGPPDGARRHASYQLRSPDGKPNGTLHFSYTISSPPQEHHALLPVSSPAYPPLGSPLQELAPRYSYPPPPATSSSHVGAYRAPPVSSPAYPTLEAPFQEPAPQCSYPPPPVSSTAYPAVESPFQELVPPPSSAPSGAYCVPPASSAAYPPLPPVSALEYLAPALPDLTPARSYTPPVPNPSMAYPMDAALPCSSQSSSFAPTPSAPPLQYPALSYPPPGTQHSKGASDAHYTAPPPPPPVGVSGGYYPPPGTKQRQYPEAKEAARGGRYYPPPGTRYT